MQRTRTQHREAAATAARRCGWAAAAVALALIACGAGGERNAERGRTGDPPAPVASTPAPATPAPATPVPAPDLETLGTGEPLIVASTNGVAGRQQRAGRRSGRLASAGRTTTMSIAVPAPPAPAPAPLSAIPDAPPPPMPPPAPALDPKEAIERASVPPVGDEVRSLVTCGDVASAYQELMDGNRSCRSDRDCRVLEGSCEIGLGGCFYAVHRSVSYDDTDALAARYRDLACGGPVCRCSGAPEQARCDQGVCTAG